MLKFKDTVLFDYDGTLADTTALIIQSWQHTYKVRYGREGKVEEILKTLGEPLIDSMKEKFPEFDPYETMDIYRGYQKDRYEDMVRLFPGAIETVHRLKKEGYRLGIVTSRRYQSTMTGLEVLGLIHHVDGIITCEDIENPKPHPQPILSCLEKLGSEAGKAIMVGDTAFDIGAANNAKVTSVLVGWTSSFPKEERIGIYKPDYVIEKFTELLSLLGLD